MSSKTFPTLEFERQLFSAGASLVIGIDEVGRGALCGPVSVGVAVLRANKHTDGWPPQLADSKLLSEKVREQLHQPVAAWVEAWSVGSASNTEIDEIGITAALALAARRAIGALPEGIRAEVSSQPQQARIILDGSHNWLAGSVGEVLVQMRPKADRDCVSVAAASVLAKVTRDREMVALEAGDPALSVFGLAGNKGYSSATHILALQQHGPSVHHRVTWLTKILGQDALF